MAIIIKHVCVVNEGQREINDVRIVGNRIAEIAKDISSKILWRDFGYLEQNRRNSSELRIYFKLSFP